MLIEDTLVVQMMSVTECMLHLPMVGMTDHRAPLALTLDDLLRDGPWGIRSDNGDIGLITLAQETALSDLEQLCGMMTHQLNQSFDG